MQNNSGKKVAIAGAGIAGLYLGQILAKAGNSVTIFEKKSEIGNAACSGLFSERIFDFVPESRGLAQNKINSAILHFPKKDIKLSFSKPFYVMSHDELDKLAAKKAVAAGAKILLNSPISKISENFDCLIGCDGALSKTRLSLGLGEPKMRLGILGYQNTENTNDFVEAWPTKQGFIWKIPRGKQVEYGVIGPVLEAKKIFDEFLKKNKIYLIKISAKIIPQGIVLPKNKNITLCGDSAGMTKPWSGGGVIWGLSAADMLAADFPDFLKYRKKAYRFLKTKERLGKFAVCVGYFLGNYFPWILPKNIKIESDFLL